MRISYSALETFENCPAKYKFQEIEKIKTSKSKEAIFGTLIHESLKILHQPNRLVSPTEEEILQYFSRNWDSSVFENPAEEMAFFHQGIKMLKDYYAKNHPAKFNIVDLETRFEAPIADGQNMHLITGKIDRIDKLNDGEFEIIDYKTTKKMPSQKMVDENLQLSIYHLGLIYRWPFLQKKPVKLSLYFLKHNEKLSTIRTAEDISRTEKHILNTLYKIEKCLNENKFEAQPNALCDWCNFQSYCPFFKHKYTNGPQITTSGNEIKNFINEFLDLRKKSDELNKKMAEIKGVLNNYCEQNQLERLFSDNGYITRLSQQRFSYDPRLIWEILEPTGKWPEVITIDSVKLKKTIKDLPLDIKNQIEKTKKLTREFKVLSIKYLKAGNRQAPIQES